MISMVAERLCGSMPMMTDIGILPDRRKGIGAGRHRYFEPGQTPFQPRPHGNPVGRKPLASHTDDTGRQPHTEPPTGYLGPTLAEIKPCQQPLAAALACGAPHTAQAEPASTR